MPDPVVIDDGGSTRIKQLKLTTATGRMDSLLEVDRTAGNPFQSKDFALGPFSQITVVCLSQTGAATAPVPTAGGSVLPINLALGDGFESFSENDQRVLGTLVDRTGPGGSAKDCEIKVKGVNGSKPIVEARHGGKQRRYIVSNAGTIEKVLVKIAGGADSEFIIPAGTVYTTIILS